MNSKQPPKVKAQSIQVIAIDGPAGAGKSTVAKRLAKTLKLSYLDTGAMYRAITLKALTNKVNLEDEDQLVELAQKTKIDLIDHPEGLQILLDGKDVTKAIRLPQVTQNVFYVAQEPLIRREMVKKQRQMGKKGGAVMEVRDIGTVVFPAADYKFYFVASKSVRAKRRHRDLLEAGKKIAVEKVLKDIVKRDKTDFNRKEGPLKRAKDAIRMDTSSLTIEQTVDKILKITGR